MNGAKAGLLLLDDDEAFLRIYSRILTAKGYKVSTAIQGDEALDWLEKNHCPVVITDLVMPGTDGIDFLQKAREKFPEVIVIILTGEGSISGAVEAMKLGAYTYLTKPINIEELLLNVERAFHFSDMRKENIILRSQLEAMEVKGQLLGESRAMREIRAKISIVAPSNATVLMNGESGTGKEIAVALLHRESPRAKKPFIKVNCAALAESLLESELFGHEKGAFTGANSIKVGRFELADGGTLFLDEIGELPPRIQTKLLRVLQEREFERVGGTKTIKTDFRLVAATNKDLIGEVKKGNFREDLYYRINVVPIHIPPLRERREDIHGLLNHFLQIYCREMGKDVVAFSPEALKALEVYEWPGNVRELKNLVERLVVFARGKQIDDFDLPEEIRKNMSEQVLTIPSFQTAKRLFEQDYIRNALERNDRNVTATAKVIGLARKNLQLKMKELGLRGNDTGK